MGNIQLENETIKDKKINVWAIIGLILGAPIWLSLLIAILSIVLSVYILLWTLLISFWAILGSMVAVSLCMMLLGIIFTLGNTKVIGLAMISAGMFCIGLSILLFYGCKLATKGIILLTKKIILYIKRYLLKREVV